MKKISTDAKRSDFLKLIKESDRGCVSVVCEFFNKRLAAILVTAVVAKIIKKKSIRRLDFDGKIKLAHASKLITSEQSKALNAIRELRNHANHTDIEFSLENMGVIAHLKILDKYAAMINSDRLMDFEDILGKIEDENMRRFEFLVTTYQIYEELQKKLYELFEML